MSYTITWFSPPSSPRTGFCRAMLSAACVVMRCQSVRLPVCPSIRLSRSYILSKRINISSIFSPSGSHNSLVFPYQTSWQYFDGTPLTWGVEYRWSKQKSRFPASIWLHGVLSTLRPARCYQRGAAGPWQVVTLIGGSKGPFIATQLNSTELN